MAPSKKRKGPVSAFTYRCETPKWRQFCAVATLLGRSPGAFFDETVDTVLAKNKITITTNEFSETADWVDPIETGTWNAETMAAVSEFEEGRAERFESKEALFKDLGI